MLKKILALCACVVLTATAFTSCDKGGNSSSAVSGASSAADSASDVSESLESGNTNVVIDTKLVIDGEEITDKDDLVMCSIGDMDISFDEFRYYWLSYSKQLKSLGYDFETQKDEVLSLLKYQTVNDLLYTYGLMEYAKDNDLDYMASDEDFETAYYSQLMNYQTEEDYVKFLTEQGLTDYALQSTLKSYLSYEVAYNSLFGKDTGKFYVGENAVKEVFASDKAVRCLQILIPYSACVELSEEDKQNWDTLTVNAKYDKLQAAYSALSDEEKEEVKKKSLALAEEAAARAHAGEDFYSLIEQYNYDPGMTPASGETYSDLKGYYFTMDYNYVEEFKEAAFQLAENQISDVVTSNDFGYHIIMRLPIDQDYVNDNIADMTQRYNEVNASVLFEEYLQDLEITYSDYFDKLDVDSIS